MFTLKLKVARRSPANTLMDRFELARKQERIKDILIARGAYSKKHNAPLRLVASTRPSQ